MEIGINAGGSDFTLRDYILALQSRQLDLDSIPGDIESAMEHHIKPVQEKLKKAQEDVALLSVALEEHQKHIGKLQTQRDELVEEMVRIIREMHKLIPLQVSPNWKELPPEAGAGGPHK